MTFLGSLAILFEQILAAYIYYVDLSATSAR